MITDNTVDDADSSEGIYLVPGDPLPATYLFNCVLILRDGDGPLFHAIGNVVYASLDGYTIIPNERVTDAIRRELELPVSVGTVYVDPPNATPAGLMAVAPIPRN